MVDSNYATSHHRLLHWRKARVATPPIGPICPQVGLTIPDQAVAPLTNLYASKDRRITQGRQRLQAVDRLGQIDLQPLFGGPGNAQLSWADDLDCFNARWLRHDLQFPPKRPIQHRRQQRVQLGRGLSLQTFDCVDFGLQVVELYDYSLLSIYAQLRRKWDFHHDFL